MKRFAFAVMAAALQAPAFGHHSPLHVDLVCTDAAGIPGLALLPLAVLVALGIVRAVARARKDR